MPTIKFCPDQIPDELRAWPQWVCWRYLWRANNKPTKVPYDPKSGKCAAVDEPRTWSDYEMAVVAYKLAFTTNHPYSGIGFVLTNTQFGAFDIDDCRDPQTGMIDDEVIRFVKYVNSCTEITVSETGLRVIGTAYGAKVHRKQQFNRLVSLETYRSAERFIVVTGNRLYGDRLNNIDTAIDETVSYLDWQTRPTASTVPTREAAQIPSDDFQACLRFNIVGKRSEVFFYVVGRLKELRWSIDEIEALLKQYPDGVAQRYIETRRLRRQIEHCFRKADGPVTIQQSRNGLLTFDARTVPPYRNGAR